MNKLVITLMAVIMLFAAGCASNPVVGTGTPIDIGDSSPLPEIAAVDDEAVDDLPDMVAAE